MNNDVASRHRAIIQSVTDSGYDFPLESDRALFNDQLALYYVLDDKTIVRRDKFGPVYVDGHDLFPKERKHVLWNSYFKAQNDVFSLKVKEIIKQIRHGTKQGLS